MRLDETTKTSFQKTGDDLDSRYPANYLPYLTYGSLSDLARYEAEQYSDSNENEDDDVFHESDERSDSRWEFDLWQYAIDYLNNE